MASIPSLALVIQTSSNGAQGQGGSSKIRGQREHMHDDLEKIHKVIVINLGGLKYNFANCQKLPSKTFYDCKVQYEPSRHQGSKKSQCYGLSSCKSFSLDVVSFEIRQPNYEDYNHKFYSMIQGKSSKL